MKKINILLNIDKTFIPKAKYVFRTFFSIIGFKPIFYNTFGPANVDIYYGIPSVHRYPVKIAYNKSSADFFKQKNVIESKFLNFVKYKGINIPFLFSGQGEIFSFYEKHCLIQKDIVASAFYFLSCWQEYVYDKVYPDEYKKEDFLQIEHDFNNIPVVDFYADILKTALKNTETGHPGKNLWGRYDYVVSVSHNLTYWNFWTDELYQKYKKNFFRHFKKHPLRAVRNIWIYRNKHNAVNYREKKIKSLIEYSSHYGVKPSVFILSGHNNSDKRMNYFEDEEIRQKISSLSGDLKFNFYGSPDSAVDISVAESEYKKLASFAKNPNGYRSFRLSSRYQKTYDLLEKTGIKYSSLSGFREVTGFRAGVSFPFYPYNHEENRHFNFLEIPVSVMDLPLFSGNFLDLNARNGFEFLKEMSKNAKILNGHLSLLWNMRMFDSVNLEKWQQIYWKFLKFTQKDNGRVLSSDQLYTFWTRRKETQEIFGAKDNARQMISSGEK
ncbi:MAG: hypothetical protein CSB55_00905 [Candidatus Cloacimonadota bacterium]|nr:MAG: hypothetical protein CSB55_00905 [Candidatus Cloacimonadota bacterium]